MTKTKTEKQKKSKPAVVAAPPVVQIPEAPVHLPRGQERLADGTIRLKTGSHDLGDEPVTYEVNGVRLKLNGRVLVASKDVNWLAINECPKCKTARKDPVVLQQFPDGHVALMFKCHNSKGCTIGGELYVQIHLPGSFVIV